MHIRHNSDLGKFFRINLNWMQVHLGISTPLFEYPHAITYLDNWFISLHEFVCEIDAKLIVIKDTYVPKLERDSDCCIMNAILNSAVTLSKSQLKHVYNWRLYFQVQTLSDLTTASGDKILPMYLHFLTQDIVRPRRSKIQWPFQTRPQCKSSFQQWARCICASFLQGRTTNLTRPLGKWLVHAGQAEYVWPVHIHKQYQSLVVVQEDNIVQYSTVHRATQRAPRILIPISMSLSPPFRMTIFRQTCLALPDILLQHIPSKD